MTTRLLLECDYLSFIQKLVAYVVINEGDCEMNVDKAACSLRSHSALAF